MKAFRLTEWGQPAQYVTVPKPTPGPNDVLIRMKAAGLCRTDIDMVGSASTLLMSSKTSRPRGSITLVGMEGGTLTVGWGLPPIGCEFSISLGSTRQDLREVCELMKQGKLRLDIQTFDFAEVQKAYDELRAGRLVGRAVVVFPDVPAVS